MARPIRPQDSFPNLKSISFDKLDPKMQGYLTRLKKLYEKRVLKGAGPDADKMAFDDQSNGGLYNESMDAMWEKLIALKKKFPEKLKNCELFHNLESRGLENFKKKFPQLFIDRFGYKDDVPNPQYQYNRAVDSGGYNAIGADSCYAEGFALAFLFILDSLEKQFSTGAEFSVEQFMDLLGDLNAISIVSAPLDSNLTGKIEASTGCNATYGHL